MSLAKYLDSVQRDKDGVSSENLPTHGKVAQRKNVHGAFQHSIRDLGTLKSKLKDWTQDATTVKFASH